MIEYEKTPATLTEAEWEEVAKIVGSKQKLAVEKLRASGNTP